MPASREKRGCCHNLVAGTDGDVSAVVTWVWNSELPQFAAMPKIALDPDVDTSGTTDYTSAGAGLDCVWGGGGSGGRCDGRLSPSYHPLTTPGRGGLTGRRHS